MRYLTNLDGLKKIDQMINNLDLLMLPSLTSADGISRIPRILGSVTLKGLTNIPDLTFLSLLRNVTYLEITVLICRPNAHQCRLRTYPYEFKSCD
jgi:hypothetical protein